jgi:hypothetical protein
MRNGPVSGIRVAPTSSQVRNPSTDGAARSYRSLTARPGLAPMEYKSIQGDTHAKTQILRLACDEPAADYPTRSIRIQSS